MATSKFDNTWNLLSVYNFEAVEENCENSDINCKICGNTMVDPHTTLCGCHFCYTCIFEYIGEEEKHCPGTGEECKEEYLKFEKNIQRDVLLRRKIVNLKVKCMNDSCPFITEISKMENHLKICPQRLRICPYGKVGCINERMEFMEDHLNFKVLKHSTLLVEAVHQLNNEINKLKDKVEQNENEIKELKEEKEINKKEIICLKEFDGKKEVLIKQIQGEMNGINKTLTESKRNLNKNKMDLDATKKTLVKIQQENDKMKKEIQKYFNEIEDVKKNNEKLTKEIEIICNENKKLTNSTEKLEQEKEEINNSNKELKDMKEETEKIKCEMISKNTKSEYSMSEMNELKEQNKKCEIKLTDIKSDLKNYSKELEGIEMKMKERILHAREDFAWTIKDFSKKTKNNGFYDSDTFFKGDYTCCLRIKVEGIYLWFYLVLMKGTTDAKASWPMKHTITFSINHPETLRNHESWRYLYATNIFEIMNYNRPTKDKNEGINCGVISVPEIKQLISQDTILVCCSLS